MKDVRNRTIEKKEYYKKNKNRINDYNNKWRNENPDKVLNHMKTFLKKCGKIFNMTSNEYMYALQSWSKSIRKLDNHMCKNCSSTENLHAHHIMPKAEYPELSLDLDNGITLCEKCHVSIHGYEIY